MKRNIYLETIDMDAAKAVIQSEFLNNRGNRSESISVFDALSRTTADPVFAKISNPHYNAAAMDGIALDASCTYGAHERNALIIEEGKDFIYVDTGDYIESKYNAVVMIEDVYPEEDGKISIIKSSHPWEHIRVVGEDIAIGDMILPTHHRISPVDIGALLCGGLTEIEVLKKVQVGILPTGTEIVNPGTPLSPGKIIDSNSRVFENMVVEAGGLAKRYEPVIDDKELLRQAILQLVSENDVVVINAGSSAGSEDYTVGLIRELGEVFVHGIAIKPGKPTIMGKIDGKPVVGIPGYPVSAFISFKEFVIPLIEQGEPEKKDNQVEATLSKRIVSALKHKEYVRVKLGKVGKQLIATPLSRGAGVTMSLVKADGLLAIPKAVEGIEAGTSVIIERLHSMEQINRALVSIGSHDILMDHLNDLMAKQKEGYSVSSAHVGSLGGIMAIRRGETHIAPTHLLDEKTGTYNLAFVRKYVNPNEVTLLKGIKRWQGLYVEKGNPKKLTGIRDLMNPDLIFANRQKGSGTRTLLDYYLKKEEITGASISGYQNELTTHTGVALSVLSGNSHVGMGIQSVADLMGLEFIPLALEEYDFLIPKQFLEEDRVRYFIQCLKSPTFREKLEELGGYEIGDFYFVDPAKEDVSHG
ncbi:molybdopterin biosynthesis protein [Gottschalkiaceae bacterium SANA]|nr:molybdopterin biosynthesis protein [Gottschalkiaceae bacterium SANA]